MVTLLGSREIQVLDWSEVPGTPAVASISVSAKVIGQRRALLTPITLSIAASDRDISLRELIAEVVRKEVAAFSERQGQLQLRQVLTREGIEAGLAQGKILSGEREFPATEVDVQVAIETAIQGFMDGLYYVFIDDRQYDNLDSPVLIQPESQMLFLRLVPLVGG